MFPNFKDGWSSLYSIKAIKLYIYFYIFIILISYFLRPIMPKFWNNCISNDRVSSPYCSQVGSSWPDYKDKCACKDCPINFIKYVWRRLLVPIYISVGLSILVTILSMIPFTMPIGLILDGLFISTRNYWFPPMFLLTTIIPLFRLPKNLQYIFNSNDKSGYSNIKANDTGPYICGDASQFDSTVKNDDEGKKYFLTQCSINVEKLLLF